MAQPDNAFRVESMHLDGWVLVALIGELDVAASDMLREATSELVRRYDPGQVTFDCTHLTFIDIYGIGALVRTVQRFRGNGRPALTNPSPWTHQLLVLTKTESLFRIDVQGAT